MGYGKRERTLRSAVLLLTQLEGEAVKDETFKTREQSRAEQGRKDRK